MFLSEWRQFPSVPCRKKDLMTARVSMLLKSCASLTCFRACFLPGRAKDLSAPLYIYYVKKTTAVQVIWWCPLALLVKFRWRQGRALGSEWLITYMDGKCTVASMQRTKDVEHLGWVLSSVGCLVAKFCSVLKPHLQSFSVAI